MVKAKLNSLQSVIGHTFRDESLLRRALTHSSLVHEQSEQPEPEQEAALPQRDGDNEQLEFLGDAVLGLIVAEILFRRFPRLDEGEWTRLRAGLVSREHMARVGSALSIGQYLALGKGEDRSGGRKKPALLANAVEAVVAAVYLDAGLSVAGDFVDQYVVSPYLNELRSALDSGVSLGDHKSALQEMLQAQRVGPPDYALKAETGPDHRKRFLVEVRVPLDGGGSALARGIGTTKKKAEQEAARRACEKLRKRRDAAEPAGPPRRNGS